MAIRVVRLGTPRAKSEGPRFGTVRRPPRGVKKQDFARRDFFDQWLPDLSPSAPLVKWALSTPWTDARWTRYERAYRREMREPGRRRLLAVLAQLSHQADFAVGCYCEDERRCHRSILRALLEAEGAAIRAD
ncbi:MAG: DUF488 family protein [Candidatus Rokubacteria bacterium]|nr:DUF488 family protein [Candidatus Rokubacteria bacterium]